MTAMFSVTTWLNLYILTVEANLTSDIEQQAKPYPPCVYHHHRHIADCSNCNLNYVPGNLPADLLYLNMGGNNLTKIEAMSFQRYRMMTHLNLSRNHLNLLEGVYDPAAFVGLENLEVLEVGWSCDYLNLSPTRQYSYPDKAFSKLTSLKELYIDGVPNAVFGPGFQNLKQLQNLTFDGFCGLNNIHENMFNNTRHIRLLNMSHCHIYAIHRSAFSPLAVIDIIDISENYGLGMDNATTSTFGLQGTTIRVLYANSIVLPFSVNIRLKRNSFDYLYNTSIAELHLNHNAIEILEPGTLEKFPPYLRVISLNDNRFTMGQYVYEAMHMKSLEMIYFSDMAITHHFVHSEREQSLYKDIGNVVWQGPPNLQHIVARNYLMGGNIPEMNINMSRITSVDVSNNVLTEWIGRVKYCESLKIVNLSRCFCSKIHPQFFPSFPNLIALDISFNLIGDALKNDTEGVMFQSLTVLQILNLSTNRIIWLHPNIFLANKELRYLNLNFNHLSNISFRVRQLVKLKYLRLRGNQIRTIRADIRMALDTLHQHLSIDLSENPLQCTCDNINFLIWLSQTKIRKENFNSYECIDIDYESIPLNLTLIDALRTKCQSVFGIIAGGLAGIVLFLTVSIIGIVYRYRWKLKYLYYVARDRYRPQRRFGEEERYYEFDAFVSFSDDDLDFVDTLLNHLEGQGRRLCVHHRDFRPGEPIASNIVRAVQRSRRTLLILSRHFLSSTWCRYEFEMAKMEAVHEGRNVILVVKIGKIDSADVPRELMYMMRTDSYAEFPERVEDQAAFWVTFNSAI